MADKEVRIADLGNGMQVEIDTVGFDKRVDVNEDRVNDGNKYSGLKSKDEWEVIRAEAVKDPEEVVREKAQRIKDADDAARLKAEFERKERERKKKERLLEDNAARDAKGGSGVGGAGVAGKKAKKAKAKAPMLSFGDDDEEDNQDE